MKAAVTAVVGHAANDTHEHSVAGGRAREDDQLEERYPLDGPGGTYFCGSCPRRSPPSTKEDVILRFIVAS